MQSLTKFSTKKGIKSNKKSDHNLLNVELNLRWSSHNKFPRIDMYNLKKNEDFKMYQEVTEQNTELIECFEESEDFNVACTKWLKIFNGITRKCFKKIRISNSKNSPVLNKLFAKKEAFKQKIAEAQNSDNLEHLMNLETEYEVVIEEI